MNCNFGDLGQTNWHTGYYIDSEQSAITISNRRILTGNVVVSENIDVTLPEATEAWSGGKHTLQQYSKLSH